MKMNSCQMCLYMYVLVISLRPSLLLPSILHKNDISYLENVQNTQLPANASEEIWFKKKGLNIMHLNIYYFHSKLDEIKKLLSQQPNIDILCFCETFLNDQFSDDELSLDNYQFFRKDQKTNGGGLAIYIKNNINCTIRDDLQVDGIEALLLEVKPQKQKPFLLAYTYITNNKGILQTTVNNTRLDYRL